MEFYLTRRESFSAAHRLNASALSPEENLKIFGKCNHKNGHGHNYIVEVTVSGPVDETSGVVMDIAALKQIIWKDALDLLDHRNLDLDVEFFQKRPSTVENVALLIWNLLEKKIPGPCNLHQVTVHETENNIAQVRKKTV